MSFMSQDVSSPVVILRADHYSALGIMRTFRLYKPAFANPDFLEIQHHDVKYLRWIGVLVLLAGAGFAGLMGFVYYRAGGSLQSAFAETDALDPD